MFSILSFLPILVPFPLLGLPLALGLSLQFPRSLPFLTDKFLRLINFLSLFQLSANGLSSRFSRGGAGEQRVVLI